MNVSIMCKISSGQNNYDEKNSPTKAITHKVQNKLVGKLLTSTRSNSKKNVSKEAIDPMYAIKSNCNRIRGKCKENCNNLSAKSLGKKWSSANKTIGYKNFNGCGSIMTYENDPNYRVNSVGNRLPKFEYAPQSFLFCNLESSNSGSTQLLQRESEERIVEATMPSNVKFDSRTVHTQAESSNLATSSVLVSKPRQSGNHHKTKCRSSNSCGQSEDTPAVAADKIKADTIKQMTSEPNATLQRKICTLTALTSAKALKASSSSTVLASMSTSPLIVPTLSQPLIDAPFFPQAWQQFVKLLQNYLSVIISPSRLSKEIAKMTPAIRKSTRIVQSVNILHSTISSATINVAAATNTATSTRCKLSAAAAMSHVHLSGCSSSRTKFRLLPSLGATSFFTLLTLICLETVLISTVSNCAKTFYMHWNTSNSIFRIDNTDHIIDVNKGNLAFEFDQVHIICPVYEPGTFENETEKYIIYNVSKVEYETCRITNADPRVIAICDKPQKLMFFTITFRPFTPQPGGLEFLPGNDYYFISTSSKDDLNRRIGGRCSTNNMKVVFKVCCAPEEKNKTSSISGSSSGTNSGGTNNAGGVKSADSNGMITGIDDSANVDVINTQSNINQHQHINTISNIGINSVNTGLIPIGGVNIGVSNVVVSKNGGIQMKPSNGASGTSINTNIDQFNRIPIQAGINVMGNNIGGLGGHVGGGIMLTPGSHGGINMISSGGGIGIGQYPTQTGIRINNVASQQHHATHKNNNNNGKDTGTGGDGVNEGVSVDGSLININFGDGQLLPPFITTNHSNIVQSTINWPGWGRGGTVHSVNRNITTTIRNGHNIIEQNSNYYSPSHRPINIKTNSKSLLNVRTCWIIMWGISCQADRMMLWNSFIFWVIVLVLDDHYDKHPNEVVKNEELTYHSGVASRHHSWPVWKGIGAAVSWPIVNIFGTFLSRSVGGAPTAAMMISPTATRLCKNCHKDQRNLSTHFKRSVHRRSKETKPFRPCYIKFKNLILNYKNLIICSIAIVTVATYLVKFSVIAKELPRTTTTTTVEILSSSAKTRAVVPHVLLDTFSSNVNQKLILLIEFKSVFVSFIRAYESLGLISASSKGHTYDNASASISSASSSAQYFVAVRNAEKTTSNIILLYLLLIKYYRIQICSVNVKVKRFR